MHCSQLEADLHPLKTWRGCGFQEGSLRQLVVHAGYWLGAPPGQAAKRPRFLPTWVSPWGSLGFLTAWQLDPKKEQPRRAFPKSEQSKRLGWQLRAFWAILSCIGISWPSHSLDQAGHSSQPRHKRGELDSTSIGRHSGGLAAVFNLPLRACLCVSECVCVSVCVRARVCMYAIKSRCTWLNSRDWSVLGSGQFVLSSLSEQTLFRICWLTWGRRWRTPGDRLVKGV